LRLSITPIPAYQEYAGVGVFVVLYDEKLTLIFILSSEKLLSCKKWQNMGTHALPSQKFV
jgi:hypothetical protein